MFRRIVFAWQGVCLSGYYLIMWHTQVILTIIQMAYLLICDPFDSLLMTRLELMNESIFLGSLYSVFLFNKLYVTSEEFTVYVGYFCISILVFCISVHLFFLIKTVIVDFIDTVKKYYKICTKKCGSKKVNKM